MNSHYEKNFYYILGALLGDGCVYKWKDKYQFWLMGNKKFAAKYASCLSEYLGKNIKNYKRSNRNFWYVCVDNKELFNLVKTSRKDLERYGKINLSNFEEFGSYFVEGFFDAKGCIKIVKEKVRKIPKLSFDICNTNFELINFVKNFAENYLGIKKNYSNQDPFLGKDWSYRKKCYRLRIYKKDFIQKFFDKISKTKLTEEKKSYVEKWLSNFYCLASK